MAKSLYDARLIINEIDKKIVELFENRMHEVKEVALYKQENNLPIFDANREEELIERNLSYLNDETLKPYYEDFIRAMLKVSKNYQKKLINDINIGYQGTLGSFSHIATCELFPDATKKSYSTFKEIFDAINNDEIDKAVLPFENSYTGDVGEVMDLLWKNKLFIVDLLDVKINQNLIGLKNSNIKDIKTVYSHEQALSQCKIFLKGLDATLVPYSNTALAAEYIKKLNDPTNACIASKEVASLNDLKILVEDINDSKENTTRFIILSKTPSKVGNRFNLLFTMTDGKGKLLEVMKIFSKHGFNLESIKSRPLQQSPWKYYFYVEVEGRIDSKEAIQLLIDLNSKCELVKVLGSYNKE